MSSALETVTKYYEAAARKDRQALRAVLASEFTFKGPLMAFDGPDAFVEAVVGMAFDARSERSRFIVDGERVAHAFLWKMKTPTKADVPMCEVFEISDGKIRSSELFYDSKLFPAPGS